MMYGGEVTPCEAIGLGKGGAVVEVGVFRTCLRRLDLNFCLIWRKNKNRHNVNIVIQEEERPYEQCINLWEVIHLKLNQSDCCFT